jgi:hypothetical protein
MSMPSREPLSESVKTAGKAALLVARIEELQAEIRRLKEINQKLQDRLVRLC